MFKFLTEKEKKILYTKILSKSSFSVLCLIFWVINCKADFRYSWHIQEQKPTLKEFQGVSIKTCKLTL